MRKFLLKSTKLKNLEILQQKYLLAFEKVGKICLLSRTAFGQSHTYMLAYMFYFAAFLFGFEEIKESDPMLERLYKAQVYFQGLKNS